MEQEDLRNIGYGLSGAARADAIVGRVATPVSTFNCPTRRKPLAYPDLHLPRYFTDGHTNLQFSLSARSDYAANTGDSGITAWGYGPPTLAEGDNPNYWTLDHSSVTGIVFQRSEVTMGEISDGTTNTYLVGEKYVNADLYTTGTDPADNESMYAGFDNDNQRATYYVPGSSGLNRAYQPRMDTPGLTLPDAFGSAHSAAFNAVFCDGSVHSITYEIDPEVHRRLGNRHDGLPTDSDAL
jgi:prepilin-type processing-associated H-X9-DG protein